MTELAKIADQTPPLTPPKRRCRCGGAPELRHCAANHGVAWQCTRCGRPRSAWIPHSRLAGIDLQQLPRWSTDRVYMPDQQSQLPITTE
jgi:hypothetical protein